MHAMTLYRNQAHDAFQDAYRQAGGGAQPAQAPPSPRGLRLVHVSKASAQRASVLSFAHTLGEFGVVLMVGGNIPGETRVISIAIFDHVESMNYSAAHQLSAVLLVLAFLVLLAMYFVNRKWSRT